MSQSTPLLDQVKSLRQELAALKQRQSAPVPPNEQILVGNYLLTRLAQLGVKVLFLLTVTTSTHCFSENVRSAW